MGLARIRPKNTKRQDSKKLQSGLVIPLRYMSWLRISMGS